MVSYFAKKEFNWKKIPSTLPVEGVSVMLDNTFGFVGLLKLMSILHSPLVYMASKILRRIPRESLSMCHQSHPL